LNKIKSNCSLELISKLLDPFLKSLAKLKEGRVKDRIIEKIFTPLLENNATVVKEMDEDELAEAEHKHRHVDGA
jgi:hypothetical protein